MHLKKTQFRKEMKIREAGDLPAAVKQETRAEKPAWRQAGKSQKSV